MEITTGTGIMLGPLLGSMLFAWGGYSLPFYVFTVLVVFPAPFIIKMLPTIAKDIHTPSLISLHSPTTRIRSNLIIPE